jgi:hypothetical protein
MPDLLSEEETRAAFAELRSAELPHVRPPGTDSVHRTVRRRKAVRSVTVVGCAALAIGGGAVLAPNLLANNGASDNRTNGTANAIGAQPTVEPTDALGWAQLADYALGEGVGRPKWLAHSFGPVDAGSHDVAYAGTYSAYNLVVTCAGPGTMHVKMAVGTHATEADVVCGATAGEARDATKELALSAGDNAGHNVEVTAEPDAAADGKAGFAYVLMYS